LSRIQDRPEWFFPFSVAFAAHLGIIALAQVRFARPKAPALLSLSGCAAGGWLLILGAYVLIERCSALALLQGALALPAVVLAVGAFSSLQPNLDSGPLDTPRWLRQGACAAAASLLAAVPLLII